MHESSPTGHGEAEFFAISEETDRNLFAAGLVNLVTLRDTITVNSYLFNAVNVTGVHRHLLPTKGALFATSLSTFLHRAPLSLYHCQWSLHQTLWLLQSEVQPPANLLRRRSTHSGVEQHHCCQRTGTDFLCWRSSTAAERPEDLRRAAGRSPAPARPGPPCRSGHHRPLSSLTQAHTLPQELQQASDLGACKMLLTSRAQNAMQESPSARSRMWPILLKMGWGTQVALLPPLLSPTYFL